MTEHLPTPGAVQAPIGADLQALIDRNLASGLAESTLRAYRSDWHRFQSWCNLHGRTPMPADPDTLAAYISDADATITPTGGSAYSIGSMRRWLSGVNWVHARTGFQPPGKHPKVVDTLRGIGARRAEAGIRPPKLAAPLLLSDMRLIIDSARTSADAAGWAAKVSERRDSALILCAEVGAFRRSEVAGLRVGEVTPHTVDGLHVRLRQSKTSRFGQDNTIGLPRSQDYRYCPPCAVRLWREILTAWHSNGRAALIGTLVAAEPFTGHVCRDRWPATTLPDDAPLFPALHRTGVLRSTPISGSVVNDLLHRRAESAGLPDEVIKGLSGHSFRVGFVTEAARAGATEAEIRRQTRHRTPEMVDSYTRGFAPLENNAATKLGL